MDVVFLFRLLISIALWMLTVDYIAEALDSCLRESDRRAFASVFAIITAVAGFVCLFGNDLFSTLSPTGALVASVLCIVYGAATVGYFVGSRYEGNWAFGWKYASVFGSLFFLSGAVQALVLAGL